MIMFHHYLTGGEFSAVLTMSVIFQCLSVTLLALQVFTQKRADGISAKLLQLYAYSIHLRPRR